MNEFYLSGKDYLLVWAPVFITARDQPVGGDE